MTTAPRFPLAGWGLAAAVGLGLVALFIAAYTAFSAVMTREHALFAAAVVEIGAVVGALALARARGVVDGLLAFAEVAIAVTVSATYNYTQVAQAAAALKISQWELVMLALGPLAALVFLALNLGRAIRQHEQDVSAYHAGKARAAETITATEARRAEQRAYDEQAATRRAATMAHELELARIAQAASPQYAMGGGKAQPATRKPQRKAATQRTTAQLVADWRERNPQGTRAECARAIGRHASNVGKNWID